MVNKNEFIEDKESFENNAKLQLANQIDIEQSINEQAVIHKPNGNQTLLVSKQINILSEHKSSTDPTIVTSLTLNSTSTELKVNDSTEFENSINESTVSDGEAINIEKRASDSSEINKLEQPVVDPVEIEQSSLESTEDEENVFSNESNGNNSCSDAQFLDEINPDNVEMKVSKRKNCFQRMMSVDALILSDKKTFNNKDYSRNTRKMIATNGSSIRKRTFKKKLMGGKSKVRKFVQQDPLMFVSKFTEKVNIPIDNFTACLDDDCSRFNSSTPDSDVMIHPEFNKLGFVSLNNSLVNSNNSRNLTDNLVSRGVTDTNFRDTHEISCDDDLPQHLIFSNDINIKQNRVISDGLLLPRSELEDLIVDDCKSNIQRLESLNDEQTVSGNAILTTEHGSDEPLVNSRDVNTKLYLGVSAEKVAMEYVQMTLALAVSKIVSEECVNVESLNETYANDRIANEQANLSRTESDNGSSHNEYENSENRTADENVRPSNDSIDGRENISTSSVNKLSSSNANAYSHYKDQVTNYNEFAQNIEKDNQLRAYKSEDNVFDVAIFPDNDSEVSIAECSKLATNFINEGKFPLSSSENFQFPETSTDIANIVYSSHFASHYADYNHQSAGEANDNESGWITDQIAEKNSIKIIITEEKQSPGNIEEDSLLHYSLSDIEDMLFTDNISEGSQLSDDASDYHMRLLSDIAEDNSYLSDIENESQLQYDLGDIEDVINVPEGSDSSDNLSAESSMPAEMAEVIQPGYKIADNYDNILLKDISEDIQSSDNVSKSFLMPVDIETCNTYVPESNDLTTNKTAANRRLMQTAANISLMQYDSAEITLISADGAKDIQFKSDVAHDGPYLCEIAELGLSVSNIMESLQLENDDEENSLLSADTTVYEDESDITIAVESLATISDKRYNEKYAEISLSPKVSTASSAVIVEDCSANVITDSVQLRELHDAQMIGMTVKVVDNLSELDSGFFGTGNTSSDNVTDVASDESSLTSPARVSHESILMSDRDEIIDFTDIYRYDVIASEDDDDKTISEDNISPHISLQFTNGTLGNSVDDLLRRRLDTKLDDINQQIDSMCRDEFDVITNSSMNPDALIPKKNSVHLMQKLSSDPQLEIPIDNEIHSPTVGSSNTDIFNIGFDGWTTSSEDLAINSNDLKTWTENLATDPVSLMVDVNDGVLHFDIHEIGSNGSIGGSDYHKIDQNELISARLSPGADCITQKSNDSTTLCNDFPTKSGADENCFGLYKCISSYIDSEHMDPVEPNIYSESLINGSGDWMTFTDSMIVISENSSLSDDDLYSERSESKNQTAQFLDISNDVSLESAEVTSDIDSQENHLSNSNSPQSLKTCAIRADQSDILAVSPENSCSILTPPVLTYSPTSVQTILDTIELVELAIEPWQLVIEPAQQNSEQGQLVIEPGQLVVEPGQLEIEPAQLEIEPGQLVNEPGQLVIEPGQLNFEPGQLVIEPRQLVIEPGQLIIEPAHLVIEPGQLNIEPGQLVIEQGQPDIEPGQLEIEPGQLYIKPGQLFIEPGQLEIEPGHLIIEPGQLEIEPGQLVIEPGQLVIEPGQLEIEPGQLVIEPGQLEIEPGQLIIEPGQLEIEPEQLVIEPGKLNVSNSFSDKSQSTGQMTKSNQLFNSEKHAADSDSHIRNSGSIDADRPTGINEISTKSLIKKSLFTDTDVLCVDFMPNRRAFIPRPSFTAAKHEEVAVIYGGYSQVKFGDHVQTESNYEFFGLQPYSQTREPLYPRFSEETVLRDILPCPPYSNNIMCSALDIEIRGGNFGTHSTKSHLPASVRVESQPLICVTVEPRPLTSVNLEAQRLVRLGSANIKDQFGRHIFHLDVLPASATFKSSTKTSTDETDTVDRQFKEGHFHEHPLPDEVQMFSTSDTLTSATESFATDQVEYNEFRAGAVVISSPRDSSIISQTVSFHQLPQSSVVTVNTGSNCDKEHLLFDDANFQDLIPDFRELPSVRLTQPSDTSELMKEINDHWSNRGYYVDHNEEHDAATDNNRKPVVSCEEDIYYNVLSDDTESQLSHDLSNNEEAEEQEAEREEFHQRIAIDFVPGDRNIWRSTSIFDYSDVPDYCVGKSASTGDLQSLASEGKPRVSGTFSTDSITYVFVGEAKGLGGLTIDDVDDITRTATGSKYFENRELSEPRLGWRVRKPQASADFMRSVSTQEDGSQYEDSLHNCFYETKSVSVDHVKEMYITDSDISLDKIFGGDLTTWDNDDDTQNIKAPLNHVEESSIVVPQIIKCDQVEFLGDDQDDEDICPETERHISEYSWEVADLRELELFHSSKTRNEIWRQTSYVCEQTMRDNEVDEFDNSRVDEVMDQSLNVASNKELVKIYSDEPLLQAHMHSTKDIMLKNQLSHPIHKELDELTPPRLMAAEQVVSQSPRRLRYSTESTEEGSYEIPHVDNLGYEADGHAIQNAGAHYEHALPGSHETNSTAEFIYQTTNKDIAVIKDPSLDMRFVSETRQEDLNGVTWESAVRLHTHPMNPATAAVSDAPLSPLETHTSSVQTEPCDTPWSVHQLVLSTPPKLDMAPLSTTPALHRLTSSHGRQRTIETQTYADLRAIETQTIRDEAMVATQVRGENIDSEMIGTVERRQSLLVDCSVGSSPPVVSDIAPINPSWWESSRRNFGEREKAFSAEDKDYDTFKRSPTTIVGDEAASFDSFVNYRGGDPSGRQHIKIQKVQEEKQERARGSSQSNAVQRFFQNADGRSTPVTDSHQTVAGITTLSTTQSYIEPFVAELSVETTGDLTGWSQPMGRRLIQDQPIGSHSLTDNPVVKHSAKKSDIKSYNLSSFEDGGSISNERSSQDASVRVNVMLDNNSSSESEDGMSSGHSARVNNKEMSARPPSLMIETLTRSKHCPLQQSMRLESNNSDSSILPNASSQLISKVSLRRDMKEQERKRQMSYSDEQTSSTKDLLTARRVNSRELWTLETRDNSVEMKIDQQPGVTREHSVEMRIDQQPIGQYSNRSVHTFKASVGGPTSPSSLNASLTGASQVNHDSGVEFMSPIESATRHSDSASIGEESKRHEHDRATETTEGESQKWRDSELDRLRKERQKILDILSKDILPSKIQVLHGHFNLSSLEFTVRNINLLLV